MRILFIYLLLLSTFVRAQDKPIQQAITQAKAAGRADSFANLFTSSGTTQAITNALDPNQQIVNLTLSTDVLSQISSQKRNLLAISLPTADGVLELELIPATLFTPDFKVVTHVPDPSFTLDITETHYYYGTVKGNPASIVAFAFSATNVVGMIADDTGNRVLSRKKGQSTSDYAFYNETAVTTQSRPFECSTTELANAKIKSPGSDTLTKVTNSSSCVKYVGLYLEADYALYQYYSSNSNDLTADVLFLLNQVVTLYRNEGVYVQLSQLYIWNATDPYSNAAVSKEALISFRSRWNGMSNNFPGNVAHLLSSRRLGGGVAYVGGLGSRPYAYGVSASLNLDYASAYSTYSWEVEVVTHELGHNFGSNHTHWCGWPGGAIDNCWTPEPEPDNAAACSPGPAPANKGTIMSYCHQNIGIAFTNGFGPLPGNAIRTLINNTSLPITTSDGSVESVASGSWTTSTTWTCGITPSVMYNATISTGQAVQLNTTGNSKTLNINGSLDLSTTTSVISINNQP